MKRHAIFEELGERRVTVTPERFRQVDLTEKSGDPGIHLLPNTKCRRQLVDQVLGSDQLERRFGGEVRSLNNIEHMFDTLPIPSDKFKRIAAEI